MVFRQVIYPTDEDQPPRIVIGREMSRDTEIVASQLAELTRAVLRLTAELEVVRARANTVQERAAARTD